MSEPQLQVKVLYVHQASESGGLLQAPASKHWIESAETYVNENEPKMKTNKNIKRNNFRL